MGRGRTHGVVGAAVEGDADEALFVFVAEDAFGDFVVVGHVWFVGWFCCGRLRVRGKVWWLDGRS